ADGAVSTVVGFDYSGAPVIESGGPDQILWLVPAMGQAQAIMVRNPNIGWGAPEAIGDKYGIWFAANQATFVFVPGQGTFLASVPGEVVGTCG
ncbi:MAG TPA: hypothetical protein VFE10_13530, partial [Phenylobacterium sp.]|nr:hypothetical protein [Phenylobacterium sp.]